MLNINIITVIIIIIIFKAHQHKAAGRKTRLDIQNYGCNGNLLCYHGVVERNRISSYYYYYFFIPQVVKIPWVKNYKSELWDAEMQVSIIIITIIKYDSQQYEGDF